MQVNEIPEIGKISPAIFNELIFPRLGTKSDKVLVGPQHGVDVGRKNLNILSLTPSGKPSTVPSRNTNLGRQKSEHRGRNPEL